MTAVFDRKGTSQEGKDGSKRRKVKEFRALKINILKIPRFSDI